MREVDLDDHLLGENREAGRVTHRRGRHDMALLRDRHSLDHRDVRQLELLIAQRLHGFRQVLVDEHHFAGINSLAQGAVDLERHAS
ncbi:hypothetical protein D9M71_828930 [compost metagenome]